MEQVRAHPGRCVVAFSWVRNGHRGAQYALKMAQMGQNSHFVAISGSGGSKLVEQCGTWLEQVRAHPVGCDETISQVWKGHWGRHRPSKWLEKAKNGNFLAIGGPGGSKLVDQCGSKLDLVRAYPGQTDGTIPWVRNGH